MNDQIVSRASQFDRGQAAFNRGDSRDSHNMNWHAPALADWLAGFDQAALAWHLATRPQAQVVEVSPP